VSLAKFTGLTRYQFRKERMMNYTFDHIADLLLKKHGWIRVPLYIPEEELKLNGQ
jgi:hypothetical protein